MIDYQGYHGIVVDIKIGISDEEHGTIAVWQKDRYEYGADNCEHYVHFGWEKSLRVLEE